MTGKPHLVLVPGLLCNADLWAGQVEGLAEVAEVHVTTHHTRHDSIDAMADAILAEAPPTFAIAGLSFGSYVALAVTQKGGQRISHLSLIDGSAVVESEDSNVRRRAMLEMAGQGKFDDIKDILMPLFLHKDWQGSPQMTARVRAMADDIGIDAFIRQTKAGLGGGDFTAFLPQIDCPTLIICGADDIILPLKYSRDILTGVPNGKLVVIEGSAHLTTMERPETVTEVMRQWLTDELAMDGKELIVQ